MATKARAAACLVAVGVLPAAGALAQSAGPPAAQPGEAPAATGTASEAPSAAPSPSAAPVYPATGYGWSPPKPHTPTKARPGSRRGAAARSGEGGQHDAAVPGFETLGDGSTRLFIELAKPVTYVARPGRGSITFVLQGAHISRWNNTNPLVTVHFNTPVTEARLVPHGKDLWFVIGLRANVQPTVSMDAAKEGGAVLHIAFAKGDYLPAGVAPPESEPSPPSSPPPAPPPSRPPSGS
jgi:hypothetical protein